jgi:hypothetical protein
VIEERDEDVGVAVGFQRNSRVADFPPTIHDPMRFQFAKRLKEAGFPQDAVYGTFFFNGMGNLIFIDENLEGSKWATYARCPTLNELIKACGNRELEFRVRNDYSCVRTNAISNEDGVPLWFEGATPDEALGELWIALYTSTLRGNGR